MLEHPPGMQNALQLFNKMVPLYILTEPAQASQLCVTRSGLAKVFELLSRRQMVPPVRERRGHRPHNPLLEQSSHREASAAAANVPDLVTVTDLPSLFIPKTYKHFSKRIALHGSSSAWVDATRFRKWSGTGALANLASCAEELYERTMRIAYRRMQHSRKGEHRRPLRFGDDLCVSTTSDTAELSEEHRMFGS